MCVCLSVFKFWANINISGFLTLKCGLPVHLEDQQEDWTTFSWTINRGRGASLSGWACPLEIASPFHLLYCLQQRGLLSVAIYHSTYFIVFFLRVEKHFFVATSLSKVEKIRHTKRVEFQEKQEVIILCRSWKGFLCIWLASLHGPGYNACKFWNIFSLIWKLCWFIRLGASFLKSEEKNFKDLFKNWKWFISDILSCK